MKKQFLLLLLLFSISLWGQSNRTYAIGEIYDVNGIRGIVVRVNDEGTHGLIMSLDSEEKRWSAKPKKVSFGIFDAITDATDKEDGMKNMEAIERAIEKYDVDWNWFPAFQWCRNKGEGWYLPAINELVEINKAYHGGKIESNKTAKKTFNQTVKQNGGKSLNSNSIYFSSTEISASKTYSIILENGMFGYGKEEDKAWPQEVRAVRKF